MILCQKNQKENINVPNLTPSWLFFYYVFSLWAQNTGSEVKIIMALPFKDWAQSFLTVKFQINENVDLCRNRSRVIPLQNLHKISWVWCFQFPLNFRINDLRIQFLIFSWSSRTRSQAFRCNTLKDKQGKRCSCIFQNLLLQHYLL